MPSLAGYAFLEFLLSVQMNVAGVTLNSSGTMDFSKNASRADYPIK